MYVCTKMRLCTFLLSKGFHFLEEKPDRKNPRYKVWIFNNTPDLQMAIKDYYDNLPNARPDGLRCFCEAK